MNRGIKIGKVFGIQIAIDTSWLLILVLTTWNLSTAFGELQPDWGNPLRWSLALIASLLFFVSVLLHELAHSLVARAKGIPVRRITLFLFGGVSNIQKEPDSPQAEFLMAIVGPLTSIALGLALSVVAGLTVGSVRIAVSDPLQAARQLTPLTTLLMWLGSVNVIVGLFNLVPGFPLDGGRVLRSILWAVQGDLRQATRWATAVAHGIAWTMIVGGIAMVFGLRVPILGEGVANGLWLSFIGWFLNNAASTSYQRVVIQDVLEGVSVSQIMRTDPPTISAGLSVDELVHGHVMRMDDYAFPVMQQDRFVGLVTLKDVRKVSRDRWPDVPVQQIMTPRAELETTHPDEQAAEALNVLTRSEYRQLPVLDETGLRGLLRRRDLIKWMQLHSEAEWA